MVADTPVLPDVSVGAVLARSPGWRPSDKGFRGDPGETVRLPRRVAATHGLDQLVLELQHAGFTFRQARRAVWSVRDLWKAALAHGESVDTPVGTLLIRKTPSGRLRAVLEASSDLDFEVEMTRPHEVSHMSPTQNNAPGSQCPRCGSLGFANHQFQQYLDTYSSTVGGSLMPNLDPQFARVCLCGSLFGRRSNPGAGRRLSTHEQSFLESFDKAQNYQLLQSKAEERIHERLRAAVDPETIEQLSARILSAEKLIADLSAELKGRHLKPRRKPGRQEEP